jgi:outer membrane protein TolC
MQVLATQQKLLSYQKESVKSTGLPTLSFNGNYAYSGLGNKFPYFKGLGSGVNWFDVASLGLNLKVPIFTGGSTKAKVKQADIALRKLNEDISSTRLALNLAFENAKTQINNSIITLNTQKENVELARQVYENTTNNYQNGLATLTDLLNAENSLTDAQNNYSSALLSYKVAEIQLIKAQGNLRSLLNREI